MNKSEFQYLNKKVINAEFKTEPYKHIYIENFLSEKHFEELISDPQVAISGKSDEELLENLKKAGWVARPFGGSTINEKAYLNWHKNKKNGFRNQTTCSGFGMTYKLCSPSKNKITNELMKFFSKGSFYETLRKKFKIKKQEFRIDAGFQKYLDGYELSPHPDVRAKAITFMLSTHPSADAINNSHHTSYLKLKPEYEFISTFWKNNKKLDRSWLPWHWFKEEFLQTENNSIVIFSPNDYSFHGIKANYNHLNYQRSNFYGNLWFEDETKLPMPQWEDFEKLLKVDLKNKPSETATFFWKLKYKLSSLAKK